MRFTNVVYNNNNNKSARLSTQSKYDQPKCSVSTDTANIHCRFGYSATQPCLLLTCTFQLFANNKMLENKHGINSRLDTVRVGAIKLYAIKLDSQVYYIITFNITENPHASHHTKKGSFCLKKEREGKGMFLLHVQHS